jgi:prepilin-type N-terminal cleavage/methylation domain-containing protein
MSLSKSTKSPNVKSGFTLLEILLVVGIISILAGIVILAINPTKQLGDTRNAQRRSDVLTILNAIYQYTIDSTIAVPHAIADFDDAKGFSGSPDDLCVGDGTDTPGSDLAAFLVPDYITDTPLDPDGSEYYINKNTNGRITVCAPSTENGIADIEVTR